MRRAPKDSVLAGPLTGLAVALAIGLLGCADSAGHPPGSALPSGAALPPGPGTRGAGWLAGPAGHLLSAVNADIGRLSAAERAGKPGLARIAGMRLSVDAKAALLSPPPPVAAQIYRSALKELEKAGRRAASGEYRAAATSLRTGEIDITKATAAADSPTAPRSLAPRERGQPGSNLPSS
jgi:hypothetical protein